MISNVTEKNRNVLKEMSRFETRYSDPEEFLDYLNSPENIKTLSQVIKEIMISAGICKESDTDNIFLDELYSRLNKQDTPYSKKTIRRWITGETTTLEDREVAINICFALQLELNLWDVFLNKCGYNSFNIRSASDITYYYCAIKKRPLSAAKEILSKYDTAKIQTTEPEDMAPIEHTGNTTRVLRKAFVDPVWVDDDDFLNSFLIPKNQLFIGYSLTARREYYYWKNILWYIFIRDRVKTEQQFIYYHMAETNNYIGHSAKLNKDPATKDFFPILNSFESAILKFEDKKSPLYNNTSSPIYRLYKTFLNDGLHLDHLMDTLKRIIDDSKELESQVEISSFLNSVIDINDLFVYAIGSFIKKGEAKSKDQKQSTLLLNKSDSNLFSKKALSSVMNEFPYKDEFLEYESNPELINKKSSVRKIIILLYFFSYAYEFVTKFDETKPCTDIFKEIGFDEFINGLDTVLQKCNLPKLYAGNQFDLLIAGSVCEIENDDPLRFFGEVLKYSFKNSLDSD